jgi:hypothetical protein
MYLFPFTKFLLSSSSHITLTIYLCPEPKSKSNQKWTSGILKGYRRHMDNVNVGRNKDNSESSSCKLSSIFEI